MDELDAIAARIVGRDTGGERGPWSLEVYPTLRCNLDCGFCDTTERHRPAVRELSAVRWLALLDEAAALGARHLMVLGGGEPLLSTATVPLMARAKALGMTGMLTTNGTRLDAATQDALVEMAWDEVHVSVDGACPATHDGLRGRVGAFRRTVAAICQLRQRRDRAARASPRLALHTVLTRRNLAELPALVELAHAVGAVRLEVDALIAYRPEQHALALTAADRRALPGVVAQALETARRLGVTSTLAALLAPEATHRGRRLPDSGEGVGYAAAPCLRAWHHLVVQADGTTAPCCVLAGEGGGEDALGDRSVTEVWEAGPFLQRVRAGMLQGRPQARCAECSENILVHERAIRARIGT